jgi:hypothetical protein
VKKDLIGCGRIASTGMAIMLAASIADVLITMVLTWYVPKPAAKHAVRNLRRCTRKDHPRGHFSLLQSLHFGLLCNISWFADVWCSIVYDCHLAVLLCSRCLLGSTFPRRADLGGSNHSGVQFAVRSLTNNCSVDAGKAHPNFCNRPGYADAEANGENIAQI